MSAHHFEEEPMLLLKTIRHPLTLTVIGIFLIALVSMFVLKSSGSSSENHFIADNTQTLNAEIISITAQQCDATSEDQQVGEELPETVQCYSSQMKILSGEETGKEVSVIIPGNIYESGVERGEEVKLSYYPPEAGQQAYYIWNDFDRSNSLIILTAVFVAAIALIGRRRGLSSLVGLVGAYAMILYFIIPALQAGQPAALIALCGSVVIITIILYLAHGISIRTTTALLGTICGLGLTALLAVIFVGTSHLQGINGDEDTSLARLLGVGDLSSIVICGIIIAGVGVLNDVTITQASAIWELRRHNSSLSRRQLFLSGMRIGRDHLSSTIYTIAFAYAGAGLPALMLLSLYSPDIFSTLTTGAVAEEVVRTMVTSLGLVAAIPFTTGIAALAAYSSSGGAQVEKVNDSPIG